MHAQLYFEIVKGRDQIEDLGDRWEVNIKIGLKRYRM
jgi:hypothetical protein